MSITSLTKVGGVPEAFEWEWWGTQATPGIQYLPGTDTPGPVGVVRNGAPSYWPLQQDFDEDARASFSVHHHHYSWARIQVAGATRYVLPAVRYRTRYGTWLCHSVKMRVVSTDWPDAAAALNTEDDVWIRERRRNTGIGALWEARPTPSGDRPFLQVDLYSPQLRWTMNFQPLGWGNYPILGAVLYGNPLTDPPDGTWTITGALDANGDPIDEGDYGTVQTYGADPAWWVNHS